MSGNERKQEIAKAMTNVEYYPTILEENIDIESYAKSPLTKLPFAQISAIGTAFEPLTAAFQSIVLGNSGASGIYRVTVPNGGHLAEFRDGSGYLGSVLTPDGAVGGGQAVLNPLACDPTMLFMAAALMNINQKLDAIQEVQQEIIEILQQKEKAKLRGNLNFLADVLNNYKYNWTNEKYKNSNHIKVLDIRQESEQSILFYREQIEKKTKKQSFLHADKNVKDTLKTVASEFREYQLSLYLFSFSSFLEIMLLENFESAYLNAIVKKIEDYALQYRELYTQCYNQLEGYSKSSLESYFFSGLGTVNKVAGNAVAKIPVVSKSQLDETLIKTGNRMEQLNSKKTEKIMKHLVHTQSGVVRPFIENINAVNRLYNQPLEILFDRENVYIALSKK